MSDEVYKMPAPEVGEGVLWYPDGDTAQQPLPALVTRVGYETVCVSIFDSATINTRIRDGVRHLSDPRARNLETRDNGGWEFHPHGLLLRNLRKQVDELYSAIK